MGMKGESKQRLRQRTGASMSTALLCQMMILQSKVAAMRRVRAAIGSQEYGLTGHPNRGRTLTGADPGGSLGAMDGSKTLGNRTEPTGMAGNAGSAQPPTL